jgi:hypothetical protein
MFQRAGFRKGACRFSSGSRIGLKDNQDDTSEGSPPVLVPVRLTNERVLGAKRVFNHVMAKEALARCQAPQNSRNSAALNVLYTKSKSDVLNFTAGAGNQPTANTTAHSFVGDD